MRQVLGIAGRLTHLERSPEEIVREDCPERTPGSAGDGAAAAPSEYLVSARAPPHSQGHTLKVRSQLGVQAWGLRPWVKISTRLALIALLLRL